MLLPLKIYNLFVAIAVFISCIPSFSSFPRLFIKPGNEQLEGFILHLQDSVTVTIIEIPIQIIGVKPFL